MHGQKLYFKNSNFIQNCDSLCYVKLNWVQLYPKVHSMKKYSTLYLIIILKLQVNYMEEYCELAFFTIWYTLSDKIKILNIIFKKSPLRSVSNVKFHTPLQHLLCCFLAILISLQLSFCAQLVPPERKMQPWFIKSKG